MVYYENYQVFLEACLKLKEKYQFQFFDFYWISLRSMTVLVGRAK